MPILETFSALFVIALTFGLYSMLGQRKAELVEIVESRVSWQASARAGLGKWIAISNNVAAITSLATVYVFFIGSARLFGWWTFACCASIFLGSYITNFFTERIRSRQEIAITLSEAQQKGAVLASFADLFTASHHYSRLVKAVSMLAIAGVVWMEFAVFGDITGSLLNYSTDGKVVLVWVVCFGVVYFTLRFGLRGMFLTDILHAPLIVGAGAFLLLGAVIVFTTAGQGSALNWKALGLPILDTLTCVLFLLHVLILNSFLVLVSESHWLRLWMLGDAEVIQQKSAQGVTAVTWAMLIFVGLLASAISGGKIDIEAIATFLRRIENFTPLFVVAFWVGGMASLFSTADCQIFCFRLVQVFKPGTGISGNRVLVAAPFLTSLAVATAVSFLYYTIRFHGIQFDKIVFSVIPFTLSLLPLLFALAFRKEPSFIALAVSVVGYVAIAAIGLSWPAENMKATLVAAFWPVAVACAQVWFGASQPSKASHASGA